MRSGRRGSRLWRPLGLVLIAAAVAVALDPEYPLPRSVPTPSSAPGQGLLVPSPVSPRGSFTGDVTADAVRFVWSQGGHSGEGDGQATDLYIVVLDEQLEEIARQRVAGDHYVATGALGQRLCSGAQFHWQLLAVRGESRGRSAPAAFQFSR